jgi:hypothetical protein
MGCWAQVRSCQNTITSEESLNVSRLDLGPQDPTAVVLAPDVQVQMACDGLRQKIAIDYVVLHEGILAIVDCQVVCHCGCSTSCHCCMECCRVRACCRWHLFIMWLSIHVIYQIQSGLLLQSRQRPRRQINARRSPWCLPAWQLGFDPCADPWVCAQQDRQRSLALVPGGRAG